MERSCRVCAIKNLYQTHFWFWLIAQNSLCFQETLLKITYFEMGSSKTFKKLSWFFPLHPVPFCRQYHEKRKGPGTSYQSLFVLENMSRKIPFLVSYHLRNLDDIIQSGFWVISKITFANLCKSDSI